MIRGECVLNTKRVLCDQTLTNEVSVLSLITNILCVYFSSCVCCDQLRRTIFVTTFV